MAQGREGGDPSTRMGGVSCAKRSTEEEAMTIPPPIICLKDECPTPSLCFEHGEECQKNESDPQGIALARKGKGNGNTHPGASGDWEPLTVGSLIELSSQRKT